VARQRALGPGRRLADRPGCPGRAPGDFGGAPFLADILDGYQSVGRLAEGWQARVPLHQLHLLLVHTAIFGGAYRAAVLSAVRATVEQ
jgi:fructosamine-3-kinase